MSRISEAIKSNPGLEIKVIEPGVVREEVKALMDGGARMIYATGVDLGVKGIKVNYYFSFDEAEKNRHVILRTYLDRQNPVIKSVTPITSQADWSERELIEFLGIKIEGHPDPRHLWLPVNWDQLWAESPEGEASGVKIAKEAPGKEQILPMPVTVVPYGPYHPAFIESNYFKMSVEDEVVKKADLKLGFNHRSIIKLMERRDFFKDIYLAERICGFCNSHHVITFCNTVEMMGDIQVPPRANLERTLLLELERMQSHLLAIGIVGDLMGFKTMLMHSLRVREDVQDSLELISGQRVTHGLITFGGVRRDITDNQANFVLAKLKSLKKSVPEFFDQALSNDVLVGRLKNVGVLKLEDAIKIGAVGPTARSSGRRIDVRKNAPYASYEDVDWDVITESGCDCLARVKVKMRETMMSLHISEQCLNKIKVAPPGLVSPLRQLPCTEWISKTEAPRGELLHHVASNGTNTPDFVRIRVPTFINAYIMLKLIQGAWVADVPAIMGSIDPCYSCTDRVTILKSGVEVNKRLGELAAKK